MAVAAPHHKRRRRRWWTPQPRCVRPRATAASDGVRAVSCAALRACGAAGGRRAGVLLWRHARPPGARAHTHARTHTEHDVCSACMQVCMWAWACLGCACLLVCRRRLVCGDGVGAAAAAAAPRRSSQAKMRQFSERYARACCCCCRLSAWGPARAAPPRSLCPRPAPRPPPSCHPMAGYPSHLLRSGRGEGSRGGVCTPASGGGL